LNYANAESEKAACFLVKHLYFPGNNLRLLRFA
jgi:hypothetical protein